MSINDVYTENTYEFFALNVEYLDRVTSTVAQKGSNKNANVAVEDVQRETVPSLDEGGVSEEIESLEEEDELPEAVLSLKKAPEVIRNYGLSKKYDDTYRQIVEDYVNGKISKEKAAKKLTAAEDKEKKERLAAWEKEIYNPKYQDLLSYFKLKKSDIKNTSKLKNRLGDDYDTFVDLLTLYQQSYNEMKQNIWEEANARAATIGFEQIGLTVTGDDFRGESGVSEIQVEPKIVVFDYSNDEQELPIASGENVKEV